MPNPQELVRAMLALAEERLQTARRDLQANAYRDAATRAYYSMFHAADALLTAMQIKVKTHKSTVGLFGEHVVKAGLIDVEYGRMFNKAMNLRDTADYKATVGIAEDEGREAVENAGKFVAKVKELLRAKYNIG